MNTKTTVPGFIFATVGFLVTSSTIAAAETASVKEVFSHEPIFPQQSTGVRFVDASSNPPSISQPPSVTPLRAEQKILDNYGLVKESEGNQVSVRLLTGETKTYLLASNAVGARLRRGSLVGFNTNRDGSITRVSPPQVKRIYRGTLVVVEGRKIGMVTPEGDRFVTTLSEAKIARMGLAPGQPIKITQYKGTWATKVCQPGASNDDDSQPIIADQNGVSLGGPISSQQSQ